MSDDELLVIACLVGERLAFDVLIRKHAAVVHAAAVRALNQVGRGGACDANDLVQDFFADLWENQSAILSRYVQVRGKLVPYLARVAYRSFLRRLRSPAVSWIGKNSGCDPGTLDAIKDRPIPPPDPEPLVQRVLGNLSSTTRDVVEARFGVGRYTLPVPVGELAQRLGCSPAAVYRKIARVLRHRLRKLVDSEDV